MSEPKEIKKGVQALLNDLIDAVNNNVETMENDSKKFYTETDGNTEEREFNGENILDALTTGHEDMARMMQEVLETIIEKQDDLPVLQGSAIVMYEEVSNVFNIVHNAFKDLCRDYDRYILDYESREYAQSNK